jgi:hypothetical protein
MNLTITTETFIIFVSYIFKNFADLDQYLFLIYTFAVCVPYPFQISPAPYLQNCSTKI